MTALGEALAVLDRRRSAFYATGLVSSGTWVARWCAAARSAAWQRLIRRSWLSVAACPEAVADDVLAGAVRRAAYDAAAYAEQQRYEYRALAVRFAADMARADQVLGGRGEPGA